MAYISEYQVSEIPKDIGLHRISIIRGLFDADKLEAQLAGTARKICEQLFLESKHDNIPNEWALNLEQRAVAPQAAGAEEGEISTANTLVEQSKLFSLLAASHPDHIGVEGGRIRFQLSDHVNHPLHQDLMFYEAKSFLTIWIPVVEKGIRINRDCAGLRLFTPPVDRMLKKSIEQPPTICEADLQQFQTNATDDFVYPELELGDVLIFRESVPHGGYIPPSAHTYRTSFDFRIPLSYERFEHID